MAVSREIDTLGLDYARRFTAAYRAGSKQNACVRERLCEDVQFPAALVAPRESDLLCGKRLYPEVGYSVQYGGLGYYCDCSRWEGEDPKDTYAPAELEEWTSIKAFWDAENTVAKCWNAFEPFVRERLPDTYDGGVQLDHAAYALYRMAGLQLDYGKLTKLGLEGLTSEVQALAAGPCDESAAAFYDCAEASVERLRRCLQHWLKEAEALPDSARSRRLRAALGGLLTHAPQTFHEALQLVLAVQTITGTINFGRLDVVLGPILCRDLDAGSLQWSEALELMQNFYTILEEEIWHFDARIIVGGMGRPDTASADRFAMLAMETTDSLSLPMPQLSLRFCDGQNPALLEKAYDVIGHGKTFPMLYNDEVNVPAVEQAMGLDRAAAEQYLPFGCGEYMIDHQSCGTPNAIINLQRCLELAMNHGRCLKTGRQLTPDLGELADYASFEDLWQAYAATVDHLLEAAALAQDRIYTVTGQECPYSLVSLLYDDCIGRGRPIFAGGIRILGGTNETYGNTNCADSLTALNELLYTQRSYRADDVMQALRRNWAGHEDMQAAFKAAPKYGNDDDQADAMLQRVHTHVCTRTSAWAEGTDLDHFLVVVINNNHNTLWGKTTSASADGRAHGQPLAPGNSAGAGCDRKGLTALLNSQAKPDPTIHAGAVQNVKLSASFPAKHRDLYHALFRGYFKQGGTQTMVTVTSRADLEAALERPEDYANLIVRVGGFSARFIDLDTATQQEILSRTEHEG